MSRRSTQADWRLMATPTTSTATPTPDATTSAAARRISERLAQRKSDRERQAEQNRQRYPQTAAFLTMIRSRFERASVLGFSEAGTTQGEADLWDRALPWRDYWTPPKGPGISRGKSRSTSANPTGERELTL